MTTEQNGHGEDSGISASIRDWLKEVLALEEISAVLTPIWLPMKNRLMPALVTDPDQLAAADPLTPAFPVNSARIVSRLTRKPAGGKIVAVMRPCEIRAFRELVKLNQARWEDLIIVGVDCLGAYSNKDFRVVADEFKNGATGDFVSRMITGKPDDEIEGKLASACRVCEHPVADGADIVLGLYGADGKKSCSVMAETEEGQALLERMNAKPEEPPAGRKAIVDELVARRTESLNRMIEETHEATGSLEKLTSYLAGCVNCYNCRVACPVCYCRECVFVTDVFDHEPARYLQWARRKGVVKMPTDTVFYHLTRMAHMSTACVGCGQCSNACPSEIPVLELFRTVAKATQEGFDYEAGRSLAEKPPLSEFREDEFQEVVGV